MLDALASELGRAVPDALVRSRIAEMLDLVDGQSSRRAARHRAVPARDGPEPERARRPAARRGRATPWRKDLALEAVVDAEGIEVTDEMIEEWVREQAAEADEDADGAVARLMGDPADADRAAASTCGVQKALDIAVENAKEITPEQAEAREKLWTPEQESARRRR